MVVLRGLAQHGEKPAFEAAAEGTKRFQLAPGLKLDVWAAEPQLSNGVAFSLDGRGRAYVAETHRYGVSVFDITQNTNWLLADMSFRNVADRAAFLTNQFATNLALLTRDRELVRRIEDRDGDGRADHSEVVIDTPPTVVDGTAAGVLVTGGRLYFGNIPAFRSFKFSVSSAQQTGAKPGPGASAVPSENGKLEAENFLEGFGVHIGVTGHDLHGLVRGPDGRIYMSFGDRGVCLTNREGVVINLPDRGGVLRCEPDGSNLAVFCSGLRNPQDLAFDDLGNLWTVDNDTAGADDCRVLHLVEGGEYGWRTSYQHMEGFGPWVKEGLWKGGRDGILPPAGTVSQGPSGLAFYPGTGWGDRLAGKFVHCDFPGGVWAFSVRPRGASYEVDSKEKLLWNCWPTDVDFGPDGALYVMDWIQGWKMPQRGRIYRLTPNDQVPLTKEQRRETEEVRRLLGEGMARRPEKELLGLLGNADRRARLEAQWELAGRGAKSWDGFVRVARKGSGRLERLHAVWGLEQSTRHEASKAAGRAMGRLVPLVEDADPEVAAAALGVLGDARVQELHRLLPSLFGSTDPRVRRAAFAGLAALNEEPGEGRSSEGEPFSGKRSKAPRTQLFPWTEVRSAILAGAAEDPWIRQAIVRCLMTQQFGIDGRRSVIEGLCTDLDLRVVELGIEAVRRLADLRIPAGGTGVPSLTPLLAHRDPSVVDAAARAIHDVPVVEGLPALARFVTRVDCPTNLMTRVVNASFRLGTPQHALMLANFAKRRDVPDFARVAALDALADWARPPALDKVVGLWRPAFGGVSSFQFSVFSGEGTGSIKVGGGNIASSLTASSEAENLKLKTENSAPGFLFAAMDATRSAGTATMQLPRLPADLGRSIPFDEAMGFKRNAEPAKRAFLKVAGEILNPQTPDENGVRVGGGAAPEAVQLAVVDTAVRLKTKEASTHLFAHFAATNTSVTVKRAIVGALAVLNAAQASDAVRVALQDPGLRSAAVPHLDRLDGGDSVGLLSNLVEQATSPEGVRTAQVALGALGRIGGDGALPALSAFAGRLSAGQFPKALELDLRGAGLKTALSNSLTLPRSQPGAQDVLAGYRDCLVGGDAEKGRRVFRENPTVQCLRCHQVDGEGGTVGPKLDGVGGRQAREYLLRSIVWPNLDIAAGFETVALTLKDGSMAGGILKSEEGGVLAVEVTGDDGLPSLRRIPSTDVVKRERGPSAMPEGLAEQLGPIELRDLVEFLAGLK
jgi:putative heme-binding domain-containing protein